MSRWIMLFLLAASVGCDGAEAPDVDGANGANVSTQPTTQSAARPADVDDILDALEAAGREHAQIAADVRYHVHQRMTGDSELRTGRVKYQRHTETTPARFHIGFDTLKQGKGPILNDKVEYGFDGRWVTVAKHRIKQMTRYEVAAEGENIDAFKLGKGPFPLPFGQEAAVMREYFTITTRPAGPSDPPGTHYLLLIPREQHRESLAFTRLEMWIDRRRSLPVKIVSRDKNRNVTTVTFADIRTDATFSQNDFRLPRKIGWEYGERRRD